MRRPLTTTPSSRSARRLGLEFRIAQVSVGANHPPPRKASPAVSQELGDRPRPGRVAGLGGHCLVRRDCTLPQSGHDGGHRPFEFRYVFDLGSSWSPMSRRVGVEVSERSRLDPVPLEKPGKVWPSHRQLLLTTGQDLLFDHPAQRVAGNPLGAAAGGPCDRTPLTRTVRFDRPPAHPRSLRQPMVSTVPS